MTKWASSSLTSYYFIMFIKYNYSAAKIYFKKKFLVTLYMHNLNTTDITTKN